MGAQQSRSGKGDRVETSKLSPDEIASMKQGFDLVSKNAPRCDTALFSKHLKNSWEENLAEAVKSRLGLKHGPDGSIGFKEFQALGSTLLTKAVEEQAQLVMKLATRSEKGEVAVSDLKEFVENLFRSFMISRASRGETSWFESEAGLPIFSAAMTRSLGEDDAKQVDAPDIRNWLTTNPLLIRLLEAVGRWFFFLPCPAIASGPVEVGSSCGIIPSCEHPYLPKARFPTLLALPTVAYLNFELPVELRGQWRFVYSSFLQGDSFTGLVKAIIDRGPTLIVVKERGTDEVFGGFASASWRIGPSWQGTNMSFVFTLKPKLGVYRTTGYNDHYMYLNLNQETMPNGLGMGGQLKYFAFWLDAEFGKGNAAPSCTTFESPPLCSSQNFEVDCIEVWGVGPEPEKPEERPSILDANPEAKAMLEMAGRAAHSDGLRDTPTAGSPETKRLRERRFSED